MKPKFGKVFGLSSLWVCLAIRLTLGQDHSAQFDRPSVDDDQLTTLQSLTKLDDHPLFRMTYHGDYALTQPLKVSHFVPSDSDPNWACSLFVALGDADRPVYGRNFDWQDNPALILFTDTSTGSATVSMVDISYLGYSAADKQLDSVQGRQALLKAPWLPFDGMNEHGLVVGMAAVDQAKLPNDPGKPTIGSLGIIRVVLDQCKTVSEAVSLFETYNVEFSGGPQIHYLLADAEGHSALVEFSGEQMRVRTNQNPWQAATNFHFFGNEDRAAKICHRYARIQRELGIRQGRMNTAQSFALLQDVAQENTRWSAVYDLKGGAVSLVMSRNFEHPLTLRMADHQPDSGN